MADDVKDVTARSLEFQVLHVGGAGGRECRLLMRDASGNVIAGAVMDPREALNMLQQIARKLVEAGIASPILRP